MTADLAGVHIRRLNRPADDVGWARCRTLGFLDSAYFDDVEPVPTDLADSALRLVADVNGLIVGILDISIDDADQTSATIETIAVHPDWRRSAVGTRLLAAASAHLDDRGCSSLDAWTRDDVAANAWYVANGFVETFRYLHVYATTDDEIERALTGRDGLQPVRAFLHARIELEADLRRSYQRVHVCRRYELRT